MKIKSGITWKNVKHTSLKLDHGISGNLLKLNDDKTDMLNLASPGYLHGVTDNVVYVRDLLISPSQFDRNIGDTYETVP